MRTQTRHFETASDLLEWMTEKAVRLDSSRYCLAKRTDWRESCDTTAASPCDYWVEDHKDYRGDIVEAHCRGHKVTQYSLQRDGGSSWHGAPCHRIPFEIGEKLAEDWKQNQWNEFLGYRGLKRILKDLGADEGINGKIKAAKKQVANDTRRRIIKNQIETLDKFIANKGEWLSIDVKVAVEAQADALAKELINL